jgi:hypothetical protein
VLNTRVSLNKVFDGLGLGLLIAFDDYQSLQPGVGPYPGLVVRVLGDKGQPTRHLGNQTPQSPAGARRETLVVECEVRTESATFNQAVYYAGLISSAVSGKRFVRRKWLLDPDTANPNPVDAGFVSFGQFDTTLLEAEGQPRFKSAFLTWEVAAEVPVL